MEIAFDLDTSACTYTLQSGGAVVQWIDTTFSIHVYSHITPVPTVFHRYEGYVTAADTDSFTVTWTKTGTPTGTLTVIATLHFN